MKRRDPLTTLATAPLPGLDSDYLAAREKLAAGKPLDTPIPRRKYGRTEEQLSVIGCGGMVVQDVTPTEAKKFVVYAIEQGINYFDVAPFYGNAQQRLARH